MIQLIQRQWKSVCRWLLVGLVLGLMASWVVGGALCASANHPVPQPNDLAVEPVSFSSASGAMIHGWLLQTTTNRAVVILQHGIRADKSTLVQRAKLLSQAGYEVLLFDFQAHGESVGKQITLGFLESRDSQAAVEFVQKRFPGKPIGVIGVSLGAAAAALANPPLDVQAMVLEMMFPDVVTATKDRIEIRLGPLGRCLSPLLTAQIEPRIGCGLDDLRPIVAVAKIKAPKLFLAGTADQETKFSEARQIFDSAAEPKLFVPFEGARHQDLRDFAPDKYKQAVLDFFDTNLK